MAVPHDPFERLERLLFRPVSTRPDWLKAWRHEAQYLLVLARRAADDEDDELLQELEDQVREMADMVEARFTAEGLCGAFGASRLPRPPAAPYRSAAVS